MWLLRYRVPLLLAVYAVFFLHVAAFHAFGFKTVGHLGFGEFFGALSTGVITAGTLFTLVVFFHALFFGGLFCGWFCHWGILQDLAMAIYRRLGIAPRMVRVSSPWVPWVWFLIILGQVAFTWAHSGFPQQWSVVLGATPVWSGVPRSIFLICLTTICSGFLLVLMFGERAFCRLICTFRLWFSWFERWAPHKVRLQSSCVSCQRECTTSCPMGIDVAAEVVAQGKVLDTACIKCGECLNACPGKVLGSGLGKTPAEPVAPPPYVPGRPDLDASALLFPSLVSVLVLVLFCPTLGGNVSMSLGMASGIVVWRWWGQRSVSLFECLSIPLLLVALANKVDFNDPVSLGKGLVAIAVFLVLARLVGYGEIGRFLPGEARQRGMPLAVTLVVLAVTVGFAAREIRESYLLHGLRAARQAKEVGALSCALENVARVLPDPAGALRELGMVQWQEGNLASAQENLEKSLAEEFHPVAISAVFRLLKAQGRVAPAATLLERGLASYPEHVALLHLQAQEHLDVGDQNGVASICQRLLTIDPADPQAHLTLGAVLVLQNRLDEAENEFLQVHRKEPAAAARYLARLYSRMGRVAEAVPFFTQALMYAPKDPTLHFDAGINFARQERLPEAISAWEEVVKIDPSSREAVANLAAARARLAAAGSVSLPAVPPGEPMPVTASAP